MGAAGTARFRSWIKDTLHQETREQVIVIVIFAQFRNDIFQGES